MASKAKGTADSLIGFFPMGIPKTFLELIGVLPEVLSGVSGVEPEETSGKLPELGIEPLELLLLTFLFSVGIFIGSVLAGTVGKRAAGWEELGVGTPTLGGV